MAREDPRLAHTDAWAAERERDLVRASPEVAEVTRRFLAIMAAAGNPCAWDRRRLHFSGGLPLNGWALGDYHRFAGGSVKYWVVSIDGTWWFYDPEWDRDKSPYSSGASLRETKIGLDEASQLLTLALTGFGVVDPSGAGRPLLACRGIEETLETLRKVVGQTYGETMLLVWPKLAADPAFPPATHDLIQYRALGYIFWRYRYTVQQRWPAWYVGESSGSRAWITDEGNVWSEATRQDRWIPTAPRNAPGVAVVAKGAKFPSSNGYREPPDTVIMNQKSRPVRSMKLMSSASAVLETLTRLF